MNNMGNIMDSKNIDLSSSWFNILGNVATLSLYIMTYSSGTFCGIGANDVISTYQQQMSHIPSLLPLSLNNPIYCEIGLWFYSIRGKKKKNTNLGPTSQGVEQN